MADVPVSAPVVVVGGGLTGIEAAAEFAEAGRPVTLVTDVLGPSLGATGRRSVAKRLAKLRIAVIEDAKLSTRKLKGKVVLFWDTYNSRKIDLEGVNYQDLPRALHGYFRMGKAAPAGRR